MAWDSETWLGNGETWLGTVKPGLGQWNLA